MASLDGLNNNITNNINTIDGLTTLYSNGQPISSGNYVPYTGANAMVDLGSQEIKTTYAPTTGADLINKTYGDATYATQTDILAYVPYSGALGDVNLNGKGLTSGRFLVNQGSSPTASFSVDSSGNIFMPSLGTSGFLQLGTSGQVTSGAAASLTAGTIGSRQSFSGYNKFLAELQVSSLNFTSTPAFGSVSYFLAIDSAGSVIASSGSGASLTAGTLGSPQQFSGYNQFLAQLIVNTLLFSATPPSGTAAFYLGVDSGNNLITTSSIGASLTAGTFGSPQQFSGYNQFLSPLKIIGLSFSSAPSAGSSTTILALDGTNNVITTTISTAPPTQINVTSTITNAAYYFTLINANSSGVKTIYTDGNGLISFNPSTSTLSCTNINGTCSTATNAQNIYTGTTTANATFYLTFAPAFSGTHQQLNVNNTLTFNPSTNILTGSQIVASTSLTTNNILSPAASDITFTIPTANNYNFYAGSTPILNINNVGLYANALTFYCNNISTTGAGTTITFTSSDGITTNKINAPASTALTLNPKDTNGTVNFNNNGTNYLTIAGNSLVPTFNTNAYYAFAFGGSTANGMTYGSNGMSLNGSSSILYCNRYLGTGGQTAFDITSDISFKKIYVASTYMTGCIFNPASWDTGGYFCVTPAGSLGGTGQALGLYHNGAYGGINCLTPGYAWNTFYIATGQTQINCFGAGTLYTNGGNWVFISDERTKKNIKKLKTNKSLERVLAAETFTYNRIYDDMTPEDVANKPHVGLIAQKIQESNPHCVNEFDDLLGVAYGDYTIHLIGAVQEQNKIIKNQAEVIQSLKSDLLTLHQSLTSVINILNKNKLS